MDQTFKIIMESWCMGKMLHDCEKLKVKSNTKYSYCIQSGNIPLIEQEECGRK